MKKKIFCVIAITSYGPELHEFETEKAKLEWLATQSNLEDDFTAFEVEGTISGLETPHVGKDAKEVLEEMLAEETERMKPRIVETAGFQWLILPDEEDATYTNWGDGRKGDASELVTKANGDPGLGLGHCDWRLPTIDELITLIGTEQDPKKGWHWSSSPYVGGSFSAWGVYFYLGNAGTNARNFGSYVRLVRASH